MRFLAILAIMKFACSIAGADSQSAISISGVSNNIAWRYTTKAISPGANEKEVCLGTQSKMMVCYRRDDRTRNWVGLVYQDSRNIGGTKRQMSASFLYGLDEADDKMKVTVAATSRRKIATGVGFILSKKSGHDPVAEIGPVITAVINRSPKTSVFLQPTWSSAGGSCLYFSLSSSF